MRIRAALAAVAITLVVVATAGAATTTYVNGPMVNGVWYSTPSHAVRSWNAAGIANPGFVAAVCVRYLDTSGRVLSTRCSSPGSLQISQGGSGVYAKAQCRWIAYVYRASGARSAATATGHCATTW